jgi:ElaB/YqjD/DUF883 family membrane-anchored ribosome-binding protein
METDKYANEAAASADRIANKLRNGIQDTYQGAKAAEAKLTDRADELAARAASKADEAVSEARGRIKEGIQGVRDAVQTGRESISQSSEAILTFTREKPVQALLIAAVSGAFIWTLARAIGSSRE